MVVAVNILSYILFIVMISSKFFASAMKNVDCLPSFSLSQRKKRCVARVSAARRRLLRNRVLCLVVFLQAERDRRVARAADQLCPAIAAAHRSRRLRGSQTPPHSRFAHIGCGGKRLHRGKALFGDKLRQSVLIHLFSCRISSFMQNFQRICSLLRRFMIIAQLPRRNLRIVAHLL